MGDRQQPTLVGFRKSLHPVATRWPISVILEFENSTLTLQAFHYQQSMPAHEPFVNE